MRALNTMKKLLLFLALLLNGCGTIAEAPVISLTVVPSHSEEKAPYLYYYSKLQDAFVVERADGTDGFLLGNEISRLGDTFWTSQMIDTLWSPSGRWLAWGSGSQRGSDTIFQAYAVRSDNTAQRTVFAPDAGMIYDMRWLPQHDWLFVIYTVANQLPHLLIMDVEQDEEILRVELPETLFLDLFLRRQPAPRFLWDFANRRFFFGDADGYWSGDFDGHFEKIHLSDSWLEGIAGHYLVFSLYDAPSQQSSTLFVNPLTGEQLTEASRVFTGVQSPNQQATLIITEHDAFLVTHANNQLHRLNIRAEICSHRSAPQWGAETPCFWMPDSRYAVLISDTRQLYRVDSVTGEVTPWNQPAFLPLDATIEDAAWTQLTGVVKWYVPNQTQSGITVVDFASQQAHTLAAYQASTPGISSDGRYLMLDSPCRSGDPNDISACLIDLDSNEARSGEVHSLVSTRFAGTGAGDFNWHGSQNWLLLGYFGGGEGVPPVRAVTSVDGTIYRELSFDWYAPQWLPDHVDTTLFPRSELPMMAVAQRYIASHGASRAIAWSPDGEHIAVITADHFLLVWSVRSGELTHEVEIMPPESFWEHRLTWLDTARIAVSWGAERSGVYNLATGDYEPQAVSPALAPANVILRSAQDEFQTVSPDEKYQVMITPHGSQEDCCYSMLKLLALPDEVPLWETRIDNGKLLLSFSPDGQSLFYLSDLAIMVRRITDGKVVFKAFGHGADVAWSPDSQSFATASSTGVYRWQIHAESH